jgi:hypothetical protein
MLDTYHDNYPFQDVLPIAPIHAPCPPRLADVEPAFLATIITLTLASASCSPMEVVTGTRTDLPLKKSVKRPAKV